MFVDVAVAETVPAERFASRGMREIKGKGLMETFFIE